MQKPSKHYSTGEEVDSPTPVIRLAATSVLTWGKYQEDVLCLGCVGIWKLGTHSIAGGFLLTLFPPLQRNHMWSNGPTRSLVHQSLLQPWRDHRSYTDGCILLDKILYTVNLYTVIWKNSYSIDRYSNRQLFHQTVIWTDSESKYRVYCRKGILYTGYSDRLPYENQVSCT